MYCKCVVYILNTLYNKIKIQFLNPIIILTLYINHQVYINVYSIYAYIYPYMHIFIYNINTYIITYDYISETFTIC